MTGQEMLEFKNWAVVGDVLNEEKFASKIVRRLEGENYNVYKVNPRSNSEKVYKSIKDVPEKIDVIDLVIHPKVGINVIAEAKEQGVDKVLIQPGAASEEILNFCSENSINVFEGCVLVELNKRG
ncbi:MAG: CoA-binding protein [Bacillota bacterium]